MYVAPIPKWVELGRIDAGVDLAKPQHFYVSALGAGTCYRYHRPGVGTWGGLGAAYFTLDTPLKVNGRVYHAWYTAECGQFLVHVGMRVYPGQRVAFTHSGWTETGFYAGQDMNAQVPTIPGKDFHAWLVKMRAA